MSKERVEVLKNFVEIIAIIAAGVWAYYTFGVKDKPGLEPRQRVESELIWNAVPDAETCEAEFKVSFENIGTTAFDISKVRLRAWEFPAIVLGDKEFARYLDVNIIQQKAALFFEKTYEIKSMHEYKIWAPFLGRYAPGAAWKHSFQFIMKMVPNKWVLFMVEFFEKDNEKSAKDATYQWESVCGGKGARQPN